MGKQTTTRSHASRIVWDNLEEWVRKKVQEFIQSLLEEEVTELLARKKSERRKAVDSSPGYRNGYGKERKLTLGCGTITVRRPRVRGLLERFESRILPLFARRSKGVSKLIPRLYLHGLSLGDFDLALLVVVAGLLDGRKVVLALEPGYRESTESWSEVLRDLKKRGMNCPCLVVGDGNLGIWGALANIYPGAPEQRCWNHKMVNVLDRLPKKLQGQAKSHLQDIVYSETRESAEAERDDFVRWCRAEGYRRAGETLLRDWDHLLSFSARALEASAND